MNDPALVELRLADVGEGLAQAEIVEWLVRPGDAVRADQPVVVVMTDKASVEIPAPVAGRVRECIGTPGAVVAVGSVLMRMESTAPRAPDAPRTATPQAAPSARRRAAELGVELRSVAGSGPNGRVLIEDVERHAGSRSPAGHADGDEVVPLRGLRRQTALAVTHAWRTVPSIADFRDVDATELVRIRSELRAQRTDRDPPLTYLPFFVRAVAAALRRHPNFNASLDLERARSRAAARATSAPRSPAGAAHRHPRPPQPIDLSRRFACCVTAAERPATPPTARAVDRRRQM